VIGSAPPVLPGEETHELRFDEPRGSHIVPATILADTLQAAQRIVHLLAMARRRMQLRRRARTPQDIERAFPVLCDLSRPGSYLQPIWIGDPSASLLSPGEIALVAEDFDRVLDAAVRGDAGEMSEVVVDANWRAAVVSNVGRLAPRPSTGFTLAVASRRAARTFDISGARQKIAALTHRAPTTAESRAVIGSLQAIDFGERRLTLLHPKTGRAFSCFYLDDVEPMLLENARQLIQVTGEVEVDAHGTPVKVVETTEICPVDLEPIPLMPFSVGGQHIEPIVPRSLTPTLDENEQSFILEDEAIGLDLVAETRAELEEILTQDLRLLWRDYALAADDTLTRGARDLKRRLLDTFRAVPNAP
jgi:hypothetical protein